MMRARNANGSPSSVDETNEPWSDHASALTAHFANPQHIKGPKPPPPPPPPPSTDPAAYYTGVESWSVWTSAVTVSADSPGNLQVIVSFPDASSDYGKGYSEANKFVPFDNIESARFLTVIDQVNDYVSGLTLVDNTTAGTSDSTADIRIGKTVTN